MPRRPRRASVSRDLRRQSGRPALSRRQLRKGKLSPELLAAARSGLLTKTNTAKGSQGRQAVDHIKGYEPRARRTVPGETVRARLGHAPAPEIVWSAVPTTSGVIEILTTTRRESSRVGSYSRDVGLLLDGDLDQVDFERRWRKRKRRRRRRVGVGRGKGHGPHGRCRACAGALLPEAAPQPRREITVNAPCTIPAPRCGYVGPGVGGHHVLGRGADGEYLQPEILLPLCQPDCHQRGVHRLLQIEGLDGPMDATPAVTVGRIGCALLWLGLDRSGVVTLPAEFLADCGGELVRASRALRSNRGMP